MGQILHGSAATTHTVRAAIQRSKASVAELAAQYHLNPKTVRKWRKRTSVEDMPMGPQGARSTVPSAEEEAACVAFRKHTLLPLDDCLYALQATIPNLTRSSLHRLFQRHGISRLPDMKGEAGPKGKFRHYPIGYFHIDIGEVRTEEGKLHMHVAIDRTSKFAFVKLEEKADRVAASAFLEDLVEAVPCKIHTILTDNGIQFTFPPRYKDGPTARFMTHMFDMRCQENGIEHRLAKPNHPWTNGQVERMNRTLKEATVKRYHYANHDQLREHLKNFVDAYHGVKQAFAAAEAAGGFKDAKKWAEEMKKQDLKLEKDGKLWLRYAFWGDDEKEEVTGRTYPHNARFDLTAPYEDAQPSMVVVQWKEDGSVGVVYPTEYANTEFEVPSWVKQ